MSSMFFFFILPALVPHTKLIRLAFLCPFYTKVRLRCGICTCLTECLTEPVLEPGHVPLPVNIARQVSVWADHLWNALSCVCCPFPKLGQALTHLCMQHRAQIHHWVGIWWASATEAPQEHFENPGAPRFPLTHPNSLLPSGDCNKGCYQKSLEWFAQAQLWRWHSPKSLLSACWLFGGISQDH